MNVTVHMAEAQADQARKLATVLKNKDKRLGLDPPADNKKVGQKRKENYDETQDANTVVTVYGNPAYCKSNPGR
jgi:hypothetical protein